MELAINKGEATLLNLELAGDRLNLNPRDPAFYQDPYPVYQQLHERAPVFYWEQFERYCFVRQADVSAILRDRRFGRSLAPVYGTNAPRPFLEVDNFSLLKRDGQWMITNMSYTIEPPADCASLEMPELEECS